MGWAINREGDRKKGTEAEYEFKDLIEKNSDYKVKLTQVEHLNNGGSGAFKMGEFIGGDADIFSEDSLFKIAHCEIKRKYPTRDGYYGIELYRLADDILIEREFDLPVYYVIKNTKRKNSSFDSRDWIYAKFSDLWDKIKGCIELYTDWYNPIGFYSVNDQILNIMHQVRVKRNLIYLTKEDIILYCSSRKPDEPNGSIKLFDKSYYSGRYGVKATLVYFKCALFEEFTTFFPEISSIFVK